jgi:hypothetical protein
MIGTNSKPEQERRWFRGLGIAWVAFSIALALHVTDEALTGFLSIYNPTVLALREQVGFWPMPTFTFGVWLTALSIGIVMLLALSAFAFRNARWFRPICYFVVVVTGIVNAMGHTLATVLGHTVASVRFARPAPGFYSSPLLFIVAFWVLLELRSPTNRVE